MRLFQAERRIDPFIRPTFDRLLRERLTRFFNGLINKGRKDEGYRLAEERIQPNEEAHLQSIIDTFSAQMRGLWEQGDFQRGGNTKTHGIVRGEFIIRDDLPAHMRRGIYAEPRTYRAWVRFSGPGPYITPDIDDIGFMSISIKLMGVPGPKLLDDEQHTLDMSGVSTPTFVTAGHQGQRPSPERGATGTPVVLLRLRRPPDARRDHADALDQDPEQPARRLVLWLRAVPARRGAGDAVLGALAAEDADPRAAPAEAPSRQLPPRRDGRHPRSAGRRV